MPPSEVNRTMHLLISQYHVYHHAYSFLNLNWCQLQTEQRHTPISSIATLVHLLQHLSSCFTSIKWFLTNSKHMFLCLMFITIYKKPTPENNQCRLSTKTDSFGCKRQCLRIPLSCSLCVICHRQLPLFLLNSSAVICVS